MPTTAEANTSVDRPSAAMPEFGEAQTLAAVITGIQEADPARGPAIPQALTVVYDDECVFCIRCQAWLAAQATHVPLYFLAAGDPAAWQRYGSHPDYRKELLVVAEDGRLWVGPDAFLMAMWATVRLRPMAHRMSRPGLKPLAQRFFARVSSGRSNLSSLAGAWNNDLKFGQLDAHVGCAEGGCSVGQAAPD